MPEANDAVIVLVADARLLVPLAILRQMGFGRIGQPEDAARLILFLASDAGAWIIGQTIHSRGA